VLIDCDEVEALFETTMEHQTNPALALSRFMLKTKEQSQQLQ
jgi:hypothetical protein